MDISIRSSNFLLDYGNILAMYNYATPFSELEMGGWYWETSLMSRGLWYITSSRSTSQRCQSSLSLTLAQG